MPKSHNRLTESTSPYLLQHADNPVAWQPWDEVALEDAKDQDKPILLSIGYSACHWCHVMAHESFESAETAAVMNELYINIKVDREERPDLDKIYQMAHQLMTQRGGGWPLTLLLSPIDHIPFFAGTYFPPEPRHGLPAFTDLLRRAETFFRENRTQIQDQKSSLVQGMNSVVADDSEHTTLSASVLDTARTQLAANFDDQQGGFGGAPKFPHPTNIERLMRHWAATQENGSGDRQALDIALFSLIKMANGGLYDHLGGGFCRYSTDEFWMIPHFEKMLYDNGPLLSTYTDAWLISKNRLFKEAAVGTAEWVMREMQSPDGGYYSAQDADSEGIEGKFYVWTQEEFSTHLTSDEMACFGTRFGFNRSANFEGSWYPHGFVEVDDLADRLGQSSDDVWENIHQTSKKLYTLREQRIKPGRDEKVLGAWNALMIKSMARSARVFKRDDFLNSANDALNFIRATLWADGRLFATSKDGHTHLNAYLDDYAFLIEAILELLQTRWDSNDLAFARELTDVLLDQFEDKDAGGFFFTSHDHEQLLHRPKPLVDEAIPSGNGIAATVLARLGHLCGEQRYLDAAERTLKYAASSIIRFPQGHNALLVALEESLYPPELIIIRGVVVDDVIHDDDDDAQSWLELAQQPYAPKRFAFMIPSDAKELPETLEDKTASQPTAWVCQGTQCLPAIDSLEKFKQYLS